MDDTWGQWGKEEWSAKDYHKMSKALVKELRYGKDIRKFEDQPTTVHECARFLSIDPALLENVVEQSNQHLSLHENFLRYKLKGER